MDRKSYQKHAKAIRKDAKSQVPSSPHRRRSFAFARALPRHCTTARFPGGCLSAGWALGTLPPCEGSLLACSARAGRRLPWGFSLQVRYHVPEARQSHPQGRQIPGSFCSSSLSLSSLELSDTKVYGLQIRALPPITTPTSDNLPVRNAFFQTSSSLTQSVFKVVL